MTREDANRRALRGIGYIPQGRDVFPDLSVRENLLASEAAGAGRLSPDYDLIYRFFPILEDRSRQRARTKKFLEIGGFESRYASRCCAAPSLELESHRVAHVDAT